jgi:hypothetical protein
MEANSDIKGAFMRELAQFDYDFELLLNNEPATEDPLPLDPALFAEAALQELDEMPPAQNNKMPPAQNVEMPPPPTDQNVRTEEEATDFIDNFTSVYGYALVTKTSKRDPKDGEISVQYLHCDHGGIYTSKIKEEDQKRQTTTRCDNCPFAVVLCHSKDLSWHLEIQNSAHTHAPSPIHAHLSLHIRERQKLLNMITT